MCGEDLVSAFNLSPCMIRNHKSHVTACNIAFIMLTLTLTVGALNLTHWYLIGVLPACYPSVNSRLHVGSHHPLHVPQCDIWAFFTFPSNKQMFVFVSWREGGGGWGIMSQGSCYSHQHVKHIPWSITSSMQTGNLHSQQQRLTLTYTGNPSCAYAQSASVCKLREEQHQRHNRHFSLSLTVTNWSWSPGNSVAELLPAKVYMETQRE